MSPFRAWMENGIRPGTHTLVGCGPWSDAQAKFEALRKLLGLGCFERVGNDRLVARIPPRKVGAVLAAVPAIQAGAQGYCWCTHGFAIPSPGQGGADANA